MIDKEETINLPKRRETDSTNIDPKSIEERRRRGRIRSKISRTRRKEYIEELERKVKTLETENFRLQSLIIGYRKENMSIEEGGSKSFINEIEIQK